MTKIQRIHACAAAVNGRGVLILGPSGSGKSNLLWALLAKGAELIGDDQVEIFDKNQSLWVRPVRQADRQIEKRGIGIFQAQRAREAELKLAVDLGRLSPSRLPEPENFEVLGQSIPMFFAKGVSQIENWLYVFLNEDMRYVFEK